MVPAKLRVVTDLLPDQWADRDLPVLIAVARLLEDGFGGVLDSTAIQPHVRLDRADLARALLALQPGYLEVEVQRGFGGGGGPPRMSVVALTERGRRAVGLWPSERNVDALVYALEQAADQAPTEEQRGKLRQAAHAVAGVGRDVMVDVLGAVAARASGLA